jgi:hypothetical protein
VEVSKKAGFFRTFFEINIVVPELSCAICHVNRMQIAQDNSGTTICSVGHIVTLIYANYQENLRYRIPNVLQDKNQLRF